MMLVQVIRRHKSLVCNFASGGGYNGGGGGYSEGGGGYSEGGDISGSVGYQGKRVYMILGGVGHRSDDGTTEG